MKPETSGMVHHWAKCGDCDFYASAKNCIGLAAQHAANTGHYVFAETGYAYSWNAARDNGDGDE